MDTGSEKASPSIVLSRGSQPLFHFFQGIETHVRGSPNDFPKMCLGSPEFAGRSLAITLSRSGRAIFLSYAAYDSRAAGLGNAFKQLVDLCPDSLFAALLSAFVNSAPCQPPCHPELASGDVV